MPQPPPLVIEGERLSDAFLRGVGAEPNRIFLEDLSQQYRVTWNEAGQYVAALIHEWETREIGQQIVLMGDSSWRTALCAMAGHLSGRLVVMADVANPATFAGDLLQRANLDAVFPEQMKSLLEPSQKNMKKVAFPYQWKEQEIARAFLTSGSTGNPKLLGSVAESRKAGVSPLFERGVQTGHFTCLSVRRPSTLAYFANFRRAIRTTGTCFFIDITKHDFGSFDSLLFGVEIAEMSFTPTMAMQLANNSKGDWRLSVESVNLSGEILTERHVSALREFFPRSLLRNNYGMTEVAGSISELLIEPSGPPLFGHIPAGVVAAGLKIEIVDDGGRELPKGVSGRVVISGLPASMEGSVAPDGCIEFKVLHQEGHLETGDMGHVSLDGLLVVEGRWQQMIKIRGERVSLLEVENVVMETGLASAVLAATYIDAKGDSAVGVLLVPTSDKRPGISDIRQRISERHRLIMCPTRVIVVNQIPVFAVGKVDRVSASLMLQQESHAEKSEVYSAVEMSLSKIVSEALGIEFAAREDDIFSLGADSLSCMQIIHDIEVQLSTFVDVAFLLSFPTLSAMASALSQQSARLSRYVPLTNRSTTPTVYWVLPGANPYMALPIAREMAEARHVALLNLGSLVGDVVTGEFAQMVATLEQAIVEDDQEGAIFVVGFSSACYLANAVAQSLIERGNAPIGLVIIDPPSHQSIVDEWCNSGKIANPIHMMTAREGVLALLDPVTADRGLFGLQLFGLSRFEPTPVSIPRLFIGSDKDRFAEDYWAPGTSDVISIADEKHLDFVREPSIVVNALREWQVMSQTVKGTSSYGGQSRDY